jgi:proteic killer suppression protein
MQIQYSSNKLEKQFSTASEIKKNFGTNAKRVSQRMDEIKASPNLSVLTQIPAANCHPLKGSRSGEWAMDISANHRMIFEIANEPVPFEENGAINKILVTNIRILKTDDYH